VGRPVGGAGAGCAGAGLLGLLVSVAIVVWLGSQGLDASRPSPTTPTSTEATAAAAPILVLDADPAPVDAPVAVRASGLPPGPATLRLCARPEPGPTIPDRCAAPLATLEPDGEGRAEVTVVLPASIDVEGRGPIGCVPEGCVAVVTPSGDGPPAIAELHLVAP